MRILFLTNVLPYPLDNGGRINTYTKIKALKGAGHEIDLLSFKETKADTAQYEEHMRQYCSGVYQVYLPISTTENKLYMEGVALRSLLTRYSFGVYKFKSKEMERLIEGLGKKKKYDCIYYDHLQLYIYEPLIKSLWPNAKAVLDEHNCESLIMERNAEVTKNILKKIFLNIEVRKLKHFECLAIDRADKTVVLSEVDEAALAKRLGKEFRSVIIPNRVADTDKIKKTNEQMGENLRIMFVGTMTWAPNNDGVLWFLENVYEKLQEIDSEIELYIVGKNPSSQVLKLARTLKNVIVTGYVNSVDPYYEMCDFMIVPLFVGSGQRIKIIEAFSRKMPVVSTTVGAESLVYQNGESILIADNPQEFIDAFSQLREAEKRKHIAEKAREIYESFYSTEAIGRRFIKIFDDL